MLALSHAPSDIPECVMHMVERFVILMYDNTIDKARRKLFTKKVYIQQIEPTKAALEKLVMRTITQGDHIWGQALLSSICQPVGAGRRRRRMVFTKLYGQLYLKLLRLAMN